MANAKKFKKEKEPEIIEPAGDDAPGVPTETDEISKLNDQLLRTIAEYDNYRKRTARERIELEGEIAAKVIAGFLPVVDNLERALQAECKDENYKKGVELIHSSFLETLKKFNVEEITEETFNPAYHQAVQKISDENFASGEITQTFQKGYKIGEKVIRFAMVAVNE